MATLVLTDAFVSIGGNDISASVQQVTLTYSGDPVEETAMGDTTHIMKAGLLNWGLELELQQDFAAAALDSILFPLLNTVVALILRPTSAVVGASNPQYTGNLLFTEYPPLGNSVGELATVRAVFVSAGALARAVA